MISICSTVAVGSADAKKSRPAPQRPSTDDKEDDHGGKLGLLAPSKPNPERRRPRLVPRERPRPRRSRGRHRHLVRLQSATPATASSTPSKPKTPAGPTSTAKSRRHSPRRRRPPGDGPRHPPDRPARHQVTVMVKRGSTGSSPLEGFAKYLLGRDFIRRCHWNAAPS